MASVRKARGKWTVAGWMGWLYDESAFEIWRRSFDLEERANEPVLAEFTKADHLEASLYKARHVEVFIVYLSGC